MSTGSPKETYSTCKKNGSTGRIGFSAPLQPLIPDDLADDVIGRESTNQVGTLVARQTNMSEFPKRKVGASDFNALSPVDGEAGNSEPQPGGKEVPTVNINDDHVESGREQDEPPQKKAKKASTKTWHIMLRAHIHTTLSEAGEEGPEQTQSKEEHIQLMVDVTTFSLRKFIADKHWKNYIIGTEMDKSGSGAHFHVMIRGRTGLQHKKDIIDDFDTFSRNFKCKEHVEEQILGYVRRDYMKEHRLLATTLTNEHVAIYQQLAVATKLKYFEGWSVVTTNTKADDMMDEENNDKNDADHTVDCIEKMKKNSANSVMMMDEKHWRQRSGYACKEHGKPFVTVLSGTYLHGTTGAHLNGGDDQRRSPEFWADYYHKWIKQRHALAERSHQMETAANLSGSSVGNTQEAYLQFAIDMEWLITNPRCPLACSADGLNMKDGQIQSWMCKRWPLHQGREGYLPSRELVTSIPFNVKVPLHFTAAKMHVQAEHLDFVQDDAVYQLSDYDQTLPEVQDAILWYEKVHAQHSTYVGSLETDNPLPVPKYECLVLYGELRSRCKTTLMKAIAGRGNFVCHEGQLNHKIDHAGKHLLILDDMDWGKISPTERKQLMTGQDFVRASNSAFGVTLKWRLPCVVCMNEAQKIDGYLCQSNEQLFMRRPRSSKPVWRHHPDYASTTKFVRVERMMNIEYSEGQEVVILNEMRQWDVNDIEVWKVKCLALQQFDWSTLTVLTLEFEKDGEEVPVAKVIEMIGASKHNEGGFFS
jgi:hypothetical protein